MENSANQQKEDNNPKQSERREFTEAPEHTSVKFPSLQQIHSDLIIAILLILPGILTLILLHGFDQFLYWLIPVCIMSLWYAWRRTGNIQQLLRLLSDSTRMDHLTDTHNRSSLNQELVKELSRSKRYEEPLSIILIDIDHFKTLNGLYGQKSGDLIIRHVASTVNSCIRLTDTLGRYDGTRFMVILPHTSADNSLIVAERVRERVMNSPLYDKNELIEVSISVGLAPFLPSDSIDTLLEHAEDALQQAGKLGSNTVSCWQ